MVRIRLALRIRSLSLASSLLQKNIAISAEMREFIIDVKKLLFGYTHFHYIIVLPVTAS